MIFGKKGKFIPRYLSPYKIVKRFDTVAYELELQADLAALHPVFTFPIEELYGMI